MKERKMKVYIRYTPHYFPSFILTTSLRKNAIQDFVRIWKQRGKNYKGNRLCCHNSFLSNISNNNKKGQDENTEI